MEKRILELAVEALEGQKAALEADIEWIRAELGRRVAAPVAAARVPRKPKGRTAAQRKAQSLKMKAYWAARKRAQAKPKAAKKPARAKAGKGPTSAAARKAQSERMKAYWAKKRKESENKAQT